MITSQVYKTSIISTIKYDCKQENLFFIRTHDILEDLEITDSQGKHLTVLSEGELLERFGIDKKAELAKNKHSTSSDVWDIIPILLPISDSVYQKIFFTYTEPVKLRRYEKSKFSMDIDIDFKFKIIPSEHQLFSEKYQIANDPFDVHILFKSGQDYQISKTYDMHVYADSDDDVVQAKQNTDGSVGYFLQGIGFEDIIVGRVEVKLVDSLRKTATIISIIALALPLLFGIPLLFDLFFIPTLEILGISMILLVGERIWILKDKYIMARWVKLQKILLAFNGFVFVIWMVLWMLKNIA